MPKKPLIKRLREFHCVLTDEAADALEAAQRDAERLDFIAERARCDPKMDGQHVWWPTSFNHRLRGPTLREAIDVAILKQAGEA